MKAQINHYWALGCFYVALLFFRGYLFGGSDHVDLLSYTRYLMQPDAYPHDFFVQQLAEHTPNERTALAWLLAQTGSALEWVCFGLHAAATLALLAALYRLAGVCIQRSVLKWAALFILFFPLSFFSLGGNDVYYNLLINSSLAKALGAWAFWCALQRQWAGWAALCAVAAVLHPVAGGQVFLLSAAGSIAAGWSGGIRALRGFGVAATAVLAVVAPYGWWLFSQYNRAQIAPDLLYEMMDFRLAHHFIPARMGSINYGLLVPLFTVGVLFFWQKNRFILGVFAGSLLPLLVYIAVTEGLHSPALFATQWFKTTIWIKFFSVVAVVSFMERFLTQKEIFQLQHWHFWEKKHRFAENAGLFLVAGSLLALMYTHPHGLVGKRAYQLPFSTWKNDPEVDIAQQAAQLTPPDAVFVQPGSVSAFKYFSQRSSYVDIKAVVHHQAGMAAWYERVGKVYGLHHANRDFGQSLSAQSDAAFGQLTTRDFLALRPLGVTHILAFRSPVLPFPVVAQNDVFVIYRLTLPGLSLAKAPQPE